MAGSTKIDLVIAQQLLTRLAYHVEDNPDPTTGMKKLEEYAASEFKDEPEALKFFTEKILDKYDLVDHRNDDGIGMIVLKHTDTGEYHMVGDG